MSHAASKVVATEKAHHSPSATESRRSTPRRKLLARVRLFALCLAGVFSLVPGVAPAQIIGIKQAREDAWLQQARAIVLCMIAYSADNAGAFPDGKSSTEIFQKLIDGNYVTDASVFYTPLPGKVKASGGQRLKPENVCFDVTSGADSDAPDELPLVYVTGFKVTLAPGGTAVPLAKPYPPGIAAAYKGNSKFMKIDAADPDGAVPNFVRADFDAQGKTYRQLTPDGPLAAK